LVTPLTLIPIRILPRRGNLLVSDNPIMAIPLLLPTG
jgi:hypothetical protein